MEEKLNSLNQENIEQFETSEIIDSRKKHQQKIIFNKSINKIHFINFCHTLPSSSFVQFNLSKFSKFSQ